MNFGGDSRLGQALLNGLRPGTVVKEGDRYPIHPIRSSLGGRKSRGEGGRKTRSSKIEIRSKFRNPKFEASLMKHLKSRKHHSKASRKDAVELLLTGRTLHELAGELGISGMTLYRWKEEYLMELANSPADNAE